MARYTMLLLVSLVSTSAVALEIPLTYQRYTADKKGFQGQSAPYPVTNETTRPDGEWKLPKLVSKVPLYQIIRLAGQERLLIVDQKSPDDKFYSRIYFDFNGNRDLTDDPPVDRAVEGRDSWFPARFPRFDVVLPVRGKPLPFSLGVFVPGAEPGLGEWLISHLSGERPTLFVDILCECSGEFDLGGQHYSIHLWDMNSNGFLDDVLGARVPNREPAVTGPQGDCDFIILSAGDQEAGFTMLPLTNKLVLGDSLFDVTVNLTEDRLVLTPFAGAVGTVKLNATFESMTLFCAEPKFSITLSHPPSTAALPPTVALPCGIYSLQGYSMSCKDNAGEEWNVCGSGDNETQTMTVVNGEEKPIPFGEPFAPKVFLLEGGIQHGFFGTKAVLGFSMYGAGRETVRSLAKTIPPGTTGVVYPFAKDPTYKMVNSDGHVVAQGRFTHGYGSQEYASVWNGARPGTYRVQCSFEPGPFKFEAKEQTLQVQ